MSFALPARFAPIEQPGSNVGGPLALEHAFVDVVAPWLRVSVFRAGVDGVALSSGLPTQSGPLPEPFLRGFLAGMQSTSLSTTSVAAGEYDAARRAFTSRSQGRGPSPARLLLTESASSGAWQQLEKQGGDVTRTRCLLAQLLAGDDALDAPVLAARSAGALAQCRVSERELEQYIRAQPQAFFAPSELVTLSASFVSASDLTMVLLHGPVARAAELEPLFASIWRSAQPGPSASQAPSRLARLTDFSRVQTGRLVGLVVGALCGALAFLFLLSWLLVALHAPTWLALAVPCCALLGPTLAELLTSSQPSPYMTSKLLAYAIGAGVALRPLQRRLDARRRTARSATSAAGPS